MSTYFPSRRRVPGRTAPGILAGAATAIGAVGLLTVAVPAQAVPMLPLAPACADYRFPGVFILKQSNGATVNFTSDTQVVRGPAYAAGTGGTTGGDSSGSVSGGVQGRHLDFTIGWYAGEDARGHYTGDVDDAGFAHGTTVDVKDPSSAATWDSTVPLACMTPPAAPAPQNPAPQNPAPQIPAPAPATAVLGAVINGSATLQAGLSGTYVVTVSNSGGVKAPVELFIIFAGKLEQTGQIGAGGGFDCQLQSPAAGVNATVRCVQQLEPGAKYDITVQGRGSVPGAGTLLAKIGNDVNQKNVAIT
jgi:hypothetical protein